MGKILLGVICLLGLGFEMKASAYPVGEVSCLEGGCLTRGWTAYDRRNGVTQIVQCYDDSCAIHGWQESVVGSNQDREAVCDGDSCFGKGWTTYDRYTGRPLGTTTCLLGNERKPDCLSAGWISRDYYGAQVIVSCVNRDCVQTGWTVHFPDGRFQNAICKAKGCFVEGWVIDQR